MANVGRTVTGITARFGQPCTIEWPAVGMGKLATPAEQIQTHIRIRERRVGNAAGAPAFETVGSLGPISRDLQGARIIVGKRTYNVVSVIEKVIEGLTYQLQVKLS